MQQKLAKGGSNRHWPYATPKCHFCRRVLNKGEEIISLGGVKSNDLTRDMHRVCLDNWLHEHPPLPGAATAKVQSAEEIEKEFQRLQRKLRSAARRKKT